MAETPVAGQKARTDDEVRWFIAHARAQLAGPPPPGETGLRLYLSALETLVPVLADELERRLPAL